MHTLLFRRLSRQLGLLPILAAPALLAQADSQDPAQNVYDLPAFSVTGTQHGYNASYGESALRFDFPILETPQSLFVINDALIEDQQAFRFDQILQNDASVQKRNNFLGAYSSHYIRGFSVDNGSNYLRNGRSFFHLASVPVEILERTEILKGPSSVLYGTVTPGGMINMVPKRPLSETVGFVKATVGTDSLRHLHLDTGGALNESKTLAYRINLATEESEYFRSFSDGQPFNVSRKIGYAAIDWKLSESTTLGFNIDVTDDDRPQDLGLINLAGDFSDLPRETIVSQPWSHYNSDVWNTGLELGHRFQNGAQLHVGYSFQDYVRDRYDNQLRSVVDAAAGDIVMRARRRVNRWEYSAYYADLAGRVATGELVHNLLVGVDHNLIDVDNNETARNVDFATNVRNPIVIADPLIGTRPEKNTSDTTRNGLYLQDMIEIGPRWRALLGLRYDEYETASYFDGNLQSAYRADNLTPRAGLVYLPRQNQSWYATVSESFEPNAPVGSSYANAGDTLDPTVGKMVEIGAKWELLEGKLLFTSALFTIDRDKSPITQTIDGEDFLVQRGLQRNRGLETALTGLIGDNFTLTASATYLDAKYVRDNDPSLVGNVPAGASDLALSLWGEYQIGDGALEGLSLQAGWFYESDRPVDDANSFDIDAYHRFDFGLKYAMPIGENRGVTYRLTVSNAFDETYYKADFATEISVERPREIRLSAQYTF